MAGGRGLVVHLLVIVVCWCMTAGDRHSPSTQSHTHQSNNNQEKTCNPISVEFTQSKIGSSSLVPDNPIHDPDMEICYKGGHNPNHRTCCSRKMEKKYTQSAEKDFYEVIRSTGSYLKGLLSTSAAQYQEYFLTMIQGAENNTETLFNQVHKIPVRDRHGALESFFMDLQAYIRRREVNIHDSVGTFFDELFPLVFRNIVNDPDSINLDEDYKECLMELRKDLYPHPFGEVPHKLGHQLSRALMAARTFLEALSLGIEAINTTDHLPLEQNCLRSLTRLRYCAQCQGHLQVRPCRNYCYNVMRGCLAVVGEVDRHWDEFVDALRSLTITMKGTYSLEDTLTELPSRISEAIMHHLETTHKFYSQVVSRCGNPSSYPDAMPPTPGQKAMEKPISVVDTTTATDLKLQTKIDTFMRSLMASKGFYRNLADTLCSADKFATGMDQDHCWNGDQLGRYNKTLVEVGLDVQMTSNPEMKVMPAHSSLITTLIDKLRHVIKLLKSKLSSDSVQSDGTVKYHGSYYGSGDDTQVDDEDYMDISGDGSGSGDYYPSPSGPNKKNRNSYTSDQDDIYIVDDNGSKTAPEPNAPSPSSGATAVPLIAPCLTYIHVTSLLSILLQALWVNG